MTDLWMIWLLGFLTGGMATFFGLVLIFQTAGRAFRYFEDWKTSEEP